jgi:hypothetical protein
MAASTRWNLAVSAETDAELRQFLERSGATGPNSLAQFVEEAVHDRIFQEAARRAKDANAGRSEEEILRVIDESLEWARSQK